MLRPDGQEYERGEWPIKRATDGEKVADEEVLYRVGDGASMRLRISAARSMTQKARSWPRSPSAATSPRKRPAIPLALTSAYSRSRPSRAAPAHIPGASGRGP